MGILNFVKYLSKTNAIEDASGESEKDFFGFVYRYYYVIGLSSYDHGLKYKIYSTICKIIIGMFIASEVYCLFTVINTLDGIIDNFNVTLLHLMGVYRYVSMIKNKALYTKLSSAMESLYFDVSRRKRADLLKYWTKRTLNYSFLLVGIGSATVTAWYIYPLVDDVEYNLMIPLHLPFDYQTPILYPIAYIMVLVAFSYTASFLMVNDCLVQVHLMHLLCQFEVLADCFENILDDTVSENKEHIQQNMFLSEQLRNAYDVKLRHLVEQHQFILDLGEGLKNMLSTPLLGQMVSSFFIICGLGYQVATAGSVSFAKLLMSVLFLGYGMIQLFVFCQLCDEFKTQSENIYNAVYYSGWEKGVSSWPKVSARLLLVMVRASRPLELTAGGMMDVSLMAFTNLVKSSYSALTMLLRFRH